MMSLIAFSASIAGTIGSALAGFILVTYDYGPMGLLGLGAILAAVIIHFFTIDPTKQVELP